MFRPNSRYAGSGTYTVRTKQAAVSAIKIPIRPAPGVRGVHSRSEGQHLDHVAAHFIADATAFWRLCDANDTIAPDALAGRDRIAIPKKEG